MKKQFGVIGNPISHSKSPMIHALFAKNSGVELEYEPYLLSIDHFENELKELVSKGLVGANITLPFKEKAYLLADELTIEAKEANAVNTLFFKEKWIGHNTDGNGLLKDLLNRCNVQLKDKRILVLGAGGAVRGILGPLLRENPSEIILANRTFEKAQNLADIFSKVGNIKAIEWQNITGHFDLIINGTSGSLSGEFPEINCDIDKHTVGYDLVYSNEPTVFMNYLMNKGAKKTFDGLGMLVEQAALSFEFWNGIYPETDEVYLKLRG